MAAPPLMTHSFRSLGSNFANMLDIRHFRRFRWHSPIEPLAIFERVPQMCPSLAVHRKTLRGTTLPDRHGPVNLIPEPPSQ
jgi:hypothetical protein